MSGIMLHHGALTHERVVASRPHTVEMSQPGRPARGAACATPHPATVDVGAEEFEAGGNVDVSVEFAVVGDDGRRLDFDVVAPRSHAVIVLAVSVGAAPVGALVGTGVPHEAVSDRRRRPVNGSTSLNLFLAELVAGGVLGWSASSLPQRPGRRPATVVIVRLVMFETREDWMRR